MLKVRYNVFGKMDHNKALLKVLLLDILPSLVDLTTDLAQAISLLVPQVCTMIIDHRHQVNSYESDHCRRMEEKRTN